MMKQGFAAVTLFCIVFVAACATVNIDLPSVTDSERDQKNQLARECQQDENCWPPAWTE